MNETKSTPSAQGIEPRSDTFATEFGRWLVERNVIEGLAVLRAQRAQRQSGERFDLVLTRLGLVSEAGIAKELSEYLRIPMVGAADMPTSLLFPDEVPLQFIRSHRLLPTAADDDVVTVATSDPFEYEAIAALGYLLNRRVETRIATPGDIDSAIERIAGRDNVVEAAHHGLASEADGESDVRRLKDLASEAPIIRLVQDLIARAVEVRASDVHLEPRDDSLRARYRVDGALYEAETIPLSMRAAVTSRIKIMANLNIAERRLPQDGRVMTSVRGKEIDLRVSTMPTVRGESVVMRILDRGSLQLDFGSLGFEDRTINSLRALLAQPNGIILVTGPTGSGKTTTLYTALNGLNTADRKVFTVEDPIEYQIAGINQIQVQPKIGLTFGAALRSILRQDPDIIMVGEIRDLETAQMAIQSSLTGHLVLSTVHTNSAAATITRLVDMGVEDYLLASTIKGVLAQRLVRRLCLQCSTPSAELEALLSNLARQHLHTDVDTSRARVARGCPACRNTGFSGRSTIDELLEMTSGVRDALFDKAQERVIEQAATSAGMVSMFCDGLNKVLAGQTTIEEVLRATRVN